MSAPPMRGWIHPAGDTPQADPTQPVDAGRLADALAVMQVPSRSSLQKQGPFVARRIADHPRHDEDQLRDLEDEVFRAGPGMDAALPRLMR